MWRRKTEVSGGEANSGKGVVKRLLHAFHVSAHAMQRMWPQHNPQAGWLYVALKFGRGSVKLARAGSFLLA